MQVPGLGPEANTQSVCRVDHAEKAKEAFDRFVAKPGPIIVGAAQGASCFGPAYEFLFILETALRRAKVPVRFERAAMNARVRAEALPEFRTFLETEGQAFLERVDAWLTAHQARADQSTDDAGAIRLGAGVYHIQDEDVRS